MTDYAAVLRKDPDSDHGVSFPDLPGCFSAGSTMSEALVMAQEALALHLDGIAEDGETIPEPMNLDLARSMMESDPDMSEGLVAVTMISVPAILPTLSEKRTDRDTRTP